MNKIELILALLAGVLLFPPCRAEDPAGIVLYLTSGDSIYLLLADHSGDSARGWSGFGGGGKEGETPAETAARETEEETRGFFSRSNLLDRIIGTDPVIDGSFHLYFLEIEFVPALIIEHNRLTTDNEAYRERGPYAWIPYSEVAKYLWDDDQNSRCPIDRSFLPQTANTDWFWDVWLRNMRKAQRLGALAWNLPCDPSLGVVPHPQTE